MSTLGPAHAPGAPDPATSTTREPHAGHVMPGAFRKSGVLADSTGTVGKLAFLGRNGRVHRQKLLPATV